MTNKQVISGCLTALAVTLPRMVTFSLAAGGSSKRTLCSDPPLRGGLIGFPQINAAPNGGANVIDTVSLQNIKAIPIKAALQTYSMAGLILTAMCLSLSWGDRHWHDY